jgi:hypothetical protein
MGALMGWRGPEQRRVAGSHARMAGKRRLWPDDVSCGGTAEASGGGDQGA